jgi:hypothetical protein
LARTSSGEPLFSVGSDLLVSLAYNFQQGTGGGEVIHLWVLKPLLLKKIDEYIPGNVVLAWFIWLITIVAKIPLYFVCAYIQV